MDTPFLEGNTVRITKNCKSKKGTEGVVTQIIGNVTYLRDEHQVMHQISHHTTT